MSDTEPFSNKWVQSYHGRIMGQPPESPPHPPPIFGVSSATADSSAATTTTTGHLNTEGRIGKSVKKRSRASRKGPTTLFNTDTTNFRAMVQQYTGAPDTTAANGPRTGGPIINFGFGAHDPHHGMMAPPSQPHLSLQQLLLLQGRGESVFSFGNNTRPSTMDISDPYLQAISSYGLPSDTSVDGNNGLHFGRDERFSRTQY